MTHSRPHSPLLRSLRLPLLAGAGFLALGAGAAQAAPAELFPLGDVRLLDGPFLHAKELDRQYIMEHDVDRLLAPFRREAGLEPKAEPYGNWEGSGLDGHTAGHYLTALAQLAATNPDDAEVAKRLDYMVAELAEIQKANGDGYVGGVPGSKQLWDEVRRGDLRVDVFSFNGKWVPWYNLHKTFTGLRDVWRLTGNEQAKQVLIGMSDWCVELLSHLSEEQMTDMLRQEHGGMNEVLADVYAITGDQKYMDAAERFSHRAILNPLLEHKDELTGLHANTQIPKVIGFARIAELGGPDKWMDAARFFWDDVVHERSAAIGGNSVREHFHSPDDFSPMIESREGPETCNTYNMLRLTEVLYRNDPDSHYADYYERALYNHILGSQHPEDGGLVYFTPMRPRHYRVYSQPEECFWCCVGSGMENHTKYGEFIYAHSDDALLVNLFIASELHWKDKGVTVRQVTDFPSKPSTQLKLSMDKSTTFPVKIRLPYWTGKDGIKAKVNGKSVRLQRGKDGYGTIERKWSDGDRIDLAFDMSPRLERLPDGSDYVAVEYGPLVLAAPVAGDIPGLIADDGRMAHAAPGEYLPLDKAPMLVGSEQSVLKSFRPVKGEPLRFSIANAVRPAEFKDLTLEPFYQIHDSRYMIYWRIVAPENYKSVVAQIEHDEQVRLALESRTLDQVMPGEQQTEVEHAFAAEKPGTGAHLGRRWRDAAEWFSYRLSSDKGEPKAIQVTYFGAERRKFDILANGVLVAHVELNSYKPDEFPQVEYPLPAEAIKASKDGVIEVRFVGRDGSRAGPIYGLRLLK